MVYLNYSECTLFCIRVIYMFHFKVAQFLFYFSMVMIIMKTTQSLYAGSYLCFCSCYHVIYSQTQTPSLSLPLSLSFSLTHTHTHSHIYRRTHTHMHTHNCQSMTYLARAPSYVVMSQSEITIFLDTIWNA